MKRTEDSLRDLWDNIKCTNIQMIGVPEDEEKKKEYQKIFERDYGLPIWVLKIEIAFKNGEETLKNVIMEKCSIIN